MASDNCSCAADAEAITSVTSPKALAVVYTLKEPDVAFPEALTGGGLAWVVEPEALAAGKTLDLETLATSINRMTNKPRKPSRAQNV